MKKPPSINQVKVADADAFDLYVQQWQERLNLKDWRIERSEKPSRTALAEVSSLDLKARLAIYKIGTDFGEAKPVTSQSLEETACHEVLHVLLHELIEYAKSPTSKDEDVDSAEHRVIHTLVGILVPKVD